ncbi:hypothetical protein EZV62_005000 [Acer yangbiense]|uniref:RNase H type-1 domain-containing protein n=1 Tax=Acer yangbiense TaxID=1000413 RepID=A0A5C7ILK3_9ROSI|nr:hypothetical protein EZV62_005000 [Acer yangbiense]
MAILRGIDFAIETCLVPVVIESDTLGVVNLIRAIGTVIDDIIYCIHGLAGGSVIYASRKVNFVAHNLPRMALTITKDCYWIEEYPPCVERSLGEDEEVEFVIESDGSRTKAADVARVDIWLGIVLRVAAVVVVEAGTLKVVDLMVEKEGEAMAVVAEGTTVVDLDILFLFLFPGFRREREMMPLAKDLILLC